MLWIMMKYLIKFASTVLILVFLCASTLNPSCKHTLIDHLFDIGVFKFGTFTLKSGKTSPFYIDLRMLASHPLVLEEVVNAYWNVIDECNYNHICGVPYSGLVIATALCAIHHQPMLVKRKEIKEHGTKKMIEGVFKTGDTCLIIEDIITTGQSILETTSELEQQGLIIKDVVVLIDRQESGIENVAQNNHRAHALLTISEIAHYLYTTNRITREQALCLFGSNQTARAQFECLPE